MWSKDEAAWQAKLTDADRRFLTEIIVDDEHPCRYCRGIGCQACASSGLDRCATGSGVGSLGVQHEAKRPRR